MSIAENVDGRNFGEFNFLDYLGQKTLANNLFQINTGIKASVKMREKTLVFGYQFAKFPNVFSCQCFLHTSYYLLCRQLLYADIGTDFILYAKFPIMLTVYVFIIMVHNWLQPYQQRILNVLDSCILMTLMLVFIGEHTTFSSTI